LVQLIQSREDLVHTESYEKRWSRLKERVDNVLSALQSTCIDSQAQAQQKLQDWLKGIDSSLHEVKVLRSWV
jgi:flagellar hook-basal body complex protein FliE